MTLKNIEALTVEEYDAFNKAIKSNLILLKDTRDLLLRLLYISMSRECGSITSIQSHIINTRLGFGSQKKKKKLDNEKIYGEKILIVPKSSGLKILWQG